jgi:ABC-type bacteriocin/lantibiotic exporter with double-glycine peptidase domain
MNSKYVLSIAKSNWKWLLTSLCILVGLPILTYYKPVLGIICFVVVCIYHKIKIRVQKEYIRELEEDKCEDEGEDDYPWFLD